MCLFFIVVSLLAACVEPQELSPENIFVLAGQSNMAGRGGVPKVNGHWNKKVPAESSPKPSILQLSLHKTWVVAHEPLHEEIDKYKTCRVGPGMHFAHEVLANDPNFGVIGLVPCAIGGTKIIDWEVALVITNNWLKELMRPKRVVAKSKRLCGIKRSLILNKKLMIDCIREDCRGCLQTFELI